MAFSENFNLIQKVLTNLFYFFFSKCRRVPKMSCKIEKRTVVKTKPESKCSRVPRQFCRKEDCSQKDVDENLYNNDPNCYYRNQIVSCFFSHTFLTASWAMLPVFGLILLSSSSSDIFFDREMKIFTTMTQIVTTHTMRKSRNMSRAK